MRLRKRERIKIYKTHLWLEQLRSRKEIRGVVEEFSVLRLSYNISLAPNRLKLSMNSTDKGYQDRQTQCIINSAFGGSAEETDVVNIVFYHSRK